MIDKTYKISSFFKMCEEYKGIKQHHNSFPLNHLQWELSRKHRLLKEVE